MLLYLPHNSTENVHDGLSETALSVADAVSADSVTPQLQNSCWFLRARALEGLVCFLEQVASVLLLQKRIHLHHTQQ